MASKELVFGVTNGELQLHTRALKDLPRGLSLRIVEDAARKFKYIKDYIAANPALFAAQVIAGTGLLATVLILPILGAVGFGSLGPVAGSVAAGWQSAIGLVEAGSAFAWFQGAAMGGAALTPVIAVGLVSVGTIVVTVVATHFGGIKKGIGHVKENITAGIRKLFHW